MRKLKLYHVLQSQKETAKHPETKWNFGCRWTEHTGEAHSEQNKHSWAVSGCHHLKRGPKGLQGKLVTQV